MALLIADDVGLGTTIKAGGSAGPTECSPDQHHSCRLGVIVKNHISRWLQLAYSKVDGGVMLKLSSPDRRPLPNAALSLVATQVRFDAQRDAVPGELLGGLQDQLAVSGHPYPQVAQLSAQELLVSLNGPLPAGPTERRGWRLTSEDDAWHLSLLPDSVSLETPQFTGFDDMLPRVLTALDAVTAQAAPTLVTRVGLRFINLLPAPETDGSDENWQQRLNAVLAAPLSDDTLRDGVLAFEQRMLLEIDDQIRSSVRSGPVHDGDGQRRFLLDIDTYTETSTLWASTQLPELISQLNDVSVSLFQHLVSESMLGYLRGEAKSP
ncbi:TIGR04255 family protein [Jatrophihabitans endophyticus]|uniref:TIGR04255 family protein n=1 Tax=Jatrophihabitans endophyticus TaxID=1206085 RepID=UPI0013566D39|nr:TIGR04255 family protein [Jatrophihabitans endophyticus]